MKRWEWGRTLRGGKGSTPQTAGDVGRIVETLYASGIVVVSAIAAAVALVLALTGSPSPGLVFDASGGSVVSVDPGGFAWRTGIRPGQRIVALSASDEDGGWSIETVDGIGQRRATVRGATDTLRLSAPLAAAALVFGLLGLVAVPTRRRRAELLAGLSLALASLPLWLAGDPVLATLVGILGPIALTVWARRWLERYSLMVALFGAVVVALSIVYALARSQGNALAADLDGLRLAATMALAAGVLMASRERAGLRFAGLATRPRVVDAVFGVALVAAAVIAANALPLPVQFVMAATAIVVLGYLRVRSRLTAIIDGVLFADMRERAAVHGADEERARLSHDLHDDPLQTLAGVIRRLEHQPDTAAEREALRTVAEQLRDLATELHPPVLDDLGLVSAIGGLRPTDTAIAFDISLSNRGYERTERPPAEIEVVLYRIVAEAVANALAHSGCRTIRIKGEVRRHHVAIDVIDDGRGVSDREIEAAMRGGHIGVASMRRRADAIDARLTVRGAPGHGTTVSVRWGA